MYQSRDQRKIITSSEEAKGKYIQVLLILNAVAYFGYTPVRPLLDEKLLNHGINGSCLPFSTIIVKQRHAMCCEEEIFFTMLRQLHSHCFVSTFSFVSFCDILLQFEPTTCLSYSKLVTKKIPFQLKYISIRSTHSSNNIKFYNFDKPTGDSDDFVVYLSNVVLCHDCNFHDLKISSKGGNVYQG